MTVGPPAAAPSSILRRDRKFDESSRVRCRQFGVPYVERVLISVVFERDRGWCWLCSGPVRLDPPTGALVLDRRGRLQAVPHPELATADHVIPLSAGGAHSYANVQLAHHACNAVWDRRSPDFYVGLVETARAAWQEKAAAAVQLTRLADILDCGHITLTLSAYSGRVHLASAIEGGWRLACPPHRSYPDGRVRRWSEYPTCPPCRDSADRLPV